MAVDVFSVAVGLAVGGIVVGMMFEVTGRGRQVPAPQPKLTTGWRLSELREPVLVARDVLDVEVPAGARVLASGIVGPAVFAACDVRQVPPVPAEFAVDMQQDKAFMFLGGVQPGAWALLTVDEEHVGRLKAEARRLWDRATTYVERHQIQDLAGRSGIAVETRGLVQDVLPYKDRFMMRLEDGGHIIGVLVQKDPEELRGSRVQVRGRLERDSTGYAVIEAEDLRRVR